MIGKTLVHYEISAELSRGGRGEVYHPAINQRGLL
jgi:hypothetical protein